MKKLIIAETLTDFRVVDLNDLYVEALSGIVFSNQYGFEESSLTWKLLKDIQLPKVINESLQVSPNHFDMPQVAPKGFELKQINVVEEVEHNSSNNLLNEISKIIQTEMQKVREDFETKVETLEEKIGEMAQFIGSSDKDKSHLILAKIDGVLDEMTLISDVNRKVTKILSTTREIEDSGTNSQEYSKKFNALKIKYKTLSVENKMAKKNLAKVIAKAKALNAKLEVAEQELEHFKSYTEKKITDSTNPDILVNDDEDRTQEYQLDEVVASESPKFNMISQDELAKDTSGIEEYTEEATGEFDISSGSLEIGSRAHADDEELESLNLEGLKKGKSFEISNKKSWSYDTGAGVVGPLRFDEMLVDMEKGNIKPDTLVKKKAGTPWMTASERLELNTEATLIFEDKENPENNKYLIERTEYRVEMQEVVSFSLMDVDKEFKGYITNLSLSGGFLEVTRFEDEFKKNTRGTLYISEGNFERAIAVDFTIMRTSHQRPRGFGIRFESLSDTIMEVLGERMIEILNQDQGQKKAA